MLGILSVVYNEVLRQRVGFFYRTLTYCILYLQTLKHMFECGGIVEETAVHVNKIIIKNNTLRSDEHRMQIAAN